MTEFHKKQCVPCEGDVMPFTQDQIMHALNDLPKWYFEELPFPSIVRGFSFNDYYETIAFVNAIAWVAHQENHHPDLVVGYNHCTVKCSTHSIKGVSENDFILASKITQLLR